MTRLKRWESPRREGRNDKGRGGSARKRQRQKQLKNLAKKLKQQNNSNHPNHPNHPNKQEGREHEFFSLLNYLRNKSISNQLSLQHRMRNYSCKCG